MTRSLLHFLGAGLRCFLAAPSPNVRERVERAAKAIAKHAEPMLVDGRRWDERRWDALSPQKKGAYRDQARAALAAPSPNVRERELEERVERTQDWAEFAERERGKAEVRVRQLEDTLRKIVRWDDHEKPHKNLPLSDCADLARAALSSPTET